MRRRAAPRRRASRGLVVLAAGVVAVALGLALDVTQLLAGPERDTVALRFQLRGPQPVDDLTVVAIDDVTFSALGRSWPFPRSLHARAVDALRKAGARVIVYDVQFTEPTKPREDLALYDAVARAPGTVLVTTETDGKGRTEILGGDRRLKAAGALAAAANLETELSNVIQRFPFTLHRLKSVAVVAARRAGGPALAPGDFPARGAWIDFRGPPGTIPTVSFSDLIAGRADPRLLRDRIVVVGATAPTLKDVHATTASRHRLMSGPEVQANGIWTALHGLPLRSAPKWIGWLAILVMGLGPAMAMLRGRTGRAVLVAPLLGVLWLVSVQVAFERGLILPVGSPLAALLLGTLSAMTTAFVLEREQVRRRALYGERLEREVFDRTEELRETQLEIVSRLGRAVESRDADTGMHVDRMSTLSHRLALAIGMPEPEADLLRHAAVLHDVGKLGIPDRVLGKPGGFDAEERTLMETHTQIGADILAGSRSALIQLAAVIARSHHERWDGTGYPDGLKGQEIPLAARICAVCDVADALLMARPYKDAWTLPTVIRELGEQRGRHFDPALVDAFLALVPELEPELLAPSEPDAATVGVLALQSGTPSTPLEAPRAEPVPRQ